MLRRISYTIGAVFSSFWKVALMLAFILFIGYASVTCIANCQASGSPYKLPGIKNAQYEVLIYNTSYTFYTDDYSIQDDIYTLNGYWQLTKNKYVYYESALPIDVKTWGKVIVRAR